MQFKLQASNIAYPGFSSKHDHNSAVYIGKSGFKSVFEETVSKASEKHLIVKYKQQTLDKYDTFLSNPKSLAKYTPKIKLILDYLEKSEGIVFIYSRYMYSGILPLAIALEHRGYSRHGAPNILASGTPNVSASNGLKYTILSGDQHLTTNIAKEVNAVNAKDNADGSKLKIILATEVASEGLDFKNIREVHILEPWFNLNRIEQIVGRAVRNRSHIELDESLRNTTIFMYANLPKTNKRESVDFRMYRISENKQRKISQVEKVLKTYSIDCNLNQDVLLFKKKHPFAKKIDLRSSQGTLVPQYHLRDRDFSRTCDFEKCNLECIPQPKETSLPIRKHHRLRYEIKLNHRFVAQLFSGSTTSYTLETLLQAYQQTFQNLIDPVLLEMTLNDMVEKKVVFRNTAGVQGRIIARSKLYLFQPIDISDMKITQKERSILPQKTVVSATIPETMLSLSTYR